MENLLTIGETAVFSIMAFASVLALAVGIEKGMLFSHIAKSGDKILHKIKENLRTGNIESLGEYIDIFPESVYARFAAFIKENYASGEGSMNHLMESKMIEERIYLERRLVILGSLGNNAPFIGLLGTVLGIIKAFYNLGTLGNTGAEVVMRSISTALLATASGLLIAIPVVIANNYFSKKLKVTTQNLEMLAKETLASYSRNGK
ncbi:MAG: MotA/TolQ/ExbB proton channel family protein [Spirochaetota bacterium]